MILLHSPRTRQFDHDLPGSFAALMDLYERNYINLRRLLPVVPPLSVTRVSQVVGALDLHLQVLERNRYTSDLNLTYRLRQDNGSISAEPDLHIRVYHDARMAEVMAARPRHHTVFVTAAHPKYEADGTNLYTRWRINRFLFKWLTYCLRQGHHFMG